MRRIAAALAFLLACSSGSGGSGGTDPPPPPPPPPPPVVRTVAALAFAPAPHDVAARGGEVYWSEQSPTPVRKVAAAGGTPVVLASLFAAGGIGVEGADAYWTERRWTERGTPADVVVVRAALDGSARRELATLQAGPAVGGARVRGGRVLVATCGTDGTCALLLVSADGGGAPAQLATVQGKITSLDLDDTYAYWLEATGTFGEEQAIVRTPLAGGAPAALVTPADSMAILGPFAVSGGALVFSEVDTRVAVPIAQGTLRRVVRIPAGGGAREVLGERTGDGGVRELTVAGTDVVWRDDAGVYLTPLDGGATTVPAATSLPANYAYTSVQPAGGTLWCSAESLLPSAFEGFVGPLDGSPIVGPVGVPRLFAADATHVYWQSSGSLARAPLAGGPVEPLAGGFVEPPRIVVGSDRVFGAAGTVAKAIDPAGGMPADAFVVRDTVSRIAADDEAFYLLTQGMELWRVPANGAAATRIASAQTTTARMVASSGHVYWTEYEAPPSMGVRVLRVGATGGDREIVAAGLSGVEDLVVAGDTVYLKEMGGGLLTVPAAGGTPSPFGGGAFAGPVALAADATHLYVGTETVIFRIPLAGGSSETLLRTQFIAPNALAVDDAGVYWTDSYWEAVFRLSPK